MEYINLYVETETNNIQSSILNNVIQMPEEWLNWFELYLTLFDQSIERETFNNLLNIIKEINITSF